MEFFFSKNLDTIICFPAKHRISSYGIPTSVTSIGDSAFSKCFSLQSITVESNNLHFASIDEILFTRDLETIICFPSNHPFLTYPITTRVRSIGNSAFYNCRNLQSITIPTSVRSIGNYAFSGCSNLHSISIPHIFPIHISTLFSNIRLSEIAIQPFFQCSCETT